jgi:GntR family transcriptional regulator, transcriptional repressor for pyruvate dehydrogenase complex
MVRPNQPIHEKLFPLKKERLNDKVVSQIKDLIYSKELKIGEKLPPERELAVRLKVSRMVVREALRSLEQSGLIEIRPGLTGGAFVVYNLQKPLFDCVYDLFNGGSLTLSHFVEARRTVECFTIKHAAGNATVEAIERLQAFNEDMVADTKDRQRFVTQNAAFHKEIANLSGNPLMTLIVQALFDLLKRIRPDFVQTEQFIKDTYKRHEAIIQAMREKDIPSCEQLMAADVEQTRKLRHAKFK